MRVTDIQRQKKRESRYSIEVDGEYSFSLSDLELSNSGLRVGDELSESQIEQWRAASDEGKAYARALHYLALRQRSRHELQAYLHRHGYHADTVEVVLERLVALGMVDDGAFAASWIADRQLLKPRSRRQLAQELSAKGVAGEELESALAGIGDEAEQAALAAIMAKKLKLPRYQDRSKLIAYLASQGFAYDQIKRALDEGH